MGEPSDTWRALRAVTLFGAASILLRAVDVWLLVRLRSLADVLADDAMPARRHAAAYDALQSLTRSARPLAMIELGTALIYLFSLMLFVYTAYRTLDALEVRALRFRPLAAALWYLVPVWNLVHLVATLQELFRASLHRAQNAPPEVRSPRVGAASLLLGGSMLLEIVADAYADNGPAALRTISLPVWTTAAVMSAAALILIGSVLATITRRLDAMQLAPAAAVQ